MVTVLDSFILSLSFLLDDVGSLAVETEIVLESLCVLDRVLDLEHRLVELKLEFLLLMFKGEGYIMQGLKQFKFTPLSLGSEWSRLGYILELDLSKEEFDDNVEINEGRVEKCP